MRNRNNQNSKIKLVMRNNNCVRWTCKSECEDCNGRGLSAARVWIREVFRPNQLLPYFFHQLPVNSDVNCFWADLQKCFSLHAKKSAQKILTYPRRTEVSHSTRRLLIFRDTIFISLFSFFFQLPCFRMQNTQMSVTQSLTNQAPRALDMYVYFEFCPSQAHFFSTQLMNGQKEPVYTMPISVKPKTREPAAFTDNRWPIKKLQ